MAATTRTVKYASMLGDAGQSVVVVEPVAPAQLGSLLLDLHGLTPAQQRVTELVLQGFSTRQIVERLCLWPHTVQEHVRQGRRREPPGVGGRVTQRVRITRMMRRRSQMRRVPSG